MRSRSSLLASAICIDALVGDPPTWPHPVRAIGELIARGESWLRGNVPAEPGAETVAGAALMLGTVAIAATVGTLATSTALAEIPLAASTLALRNLIDESEAVARALEARDLALARTSVARIVGRDTEALDESDISRATIETLAESLCDGVIAPLFYLALGGTPAALAYKAINTLDSMIGHIEPPYRDFGAFAARLDDVANWIPARIAAACIVGAACLEGRAKASLATTLGDAHRSNSPNAGQTEAAMSGALGVRLGGLNVYSGLSIIGATFGRTYDPPNAADIRRAQRITIAAASIAYASALIVAWCFDER